MEPLPAAPPGGRVQVLRPARVGVEDLHRLVSVRGLPGQREDERVLVGADGIRLGAVACRSERGRGIAANDRRRGDERFAGVGRTIGDQVVEAAAESPVLPALVIAEVGAYWPVDHKGGHRTNCL
jgi:hypothetical protein